jgi:DNA-binding NtrC family response regulator
MEGSLEDTARAALKIAESRRIRKALHDTGGNRSRAAELLKISYKTMLTKIRDYKIVID